MSSSIWYHCADCGKLTHYMGQQNPELCERCCEIDEWVNYVIDNGPQAITEVPAELRNEVASGAGLEIK